MVDVIPNRIGFAAIKSDGSVVSWGEGCYSDSTPVANELASGVVSIHGTQTAFAALKSDGSVVTWGSSSDEEMLQLNYGGDSSAVATELTSGVTKIVSTPTSFLALKSDGSTVLWGQHEWGSTGAGNCPTYADVSQQLTNVVDVFANYVAYGAITATGDLITWGGYWDECEGGDSSAITVSFSNVQTIYSNDQAFAALMNDGTVVTWGNASNGGDSSAVSAQLTDVVEIHTSTDSGVTSMGYECDAFMAIKSDGTAVTWGGCVVNGDDFGGGDSSSVASQLNNILLVAKIPAAFAVIVVSDADGDGVHVHDDACPNTPTGETVDATGCSSSQTDTDGDGVVDALDLCPSTPAGETVDTDGCSMSQLDSDLDGVLDSVDACLGTPVGETVDATGCSSSQIDTDGDGIVDSLDQCPSTPTGQAVDNNGCAASELDDDADGVSNADDACPNTPTGETVDATGCSSSQTDSDGDGVADAYDQCPNTPAGEAVDATGCPSSSSYNNFSVLGMLGNDLYYGGLDPSTNQWDLMKYNSVNGATLVKTFANGYSTGNRSSVWAAAQLGTSMFFTAYDSTNGIELWVTDGTSSGTVMVKDIRAGSDSCLLYTSPSPRDSV